MKKKNEIDQGLLRYLFFPEGGEAVFYLSLGREGKKRRTLFRIRQGTPLVRGEGGISLLRMKEGKVNTVPVGRADRRILAKRREGSFSLRGRNRAWPPCAAISLGGKKGGEGE